MKLQLVCATLALVALSAQVLPAEPARHWAFEPIRNPALPAVKAGGVMTPIDRFIQARLEEHGLGLSSAADGRTLIRRVTFDLIGLPPKTEEVEAFLKEFGAQPQAAYEKLIDRLLASPHYGEHWGRHWLDIARYADTRGYVFLQDAAYPWAWTYRDFVIEALNADLPYDQFVVQQLAADLMPLGDDKKPLRALGFLTLGGRFMNNQHDILDDRIDVVTRGLLGLTVTCARCHDHKFDPIPTKDYYSLYSVFKACGEPEVPPLYEAPPKTPEYQKFAKELEAREEKLRAFLDKKKNELVTGARERAGEYLLAAHKQRSRPQIDEFMLIADGKDLNPKMIVRWRSLLERTQKKPERVFAFWHEAEPLPEDGFAAKAKQIAAALKERNAINAIMAEAMLQQAPKSMVEVAKVYGEVLNRVEKNDKSFGGGVSAGDLDELRAVFHAPNAPPNVGPHDFSELELLPDRASQGELQKFRKEVEKWRASGTGAPPRAMVLNDLPNGPRQRVFLRGNPSNLGDPVERQFLAVLSQKRQPFAQGSGRLELARAIASPNNSLTSRVIVNRVWLHHFGKGLVTTPSDFGLRSDPPSHPELLDYLASTFMADGWSLKKLHRRILLTSAYRQASADRPEGLKIDPENVYLWKMPRHRLSFEETRDALLAAAGKLDPKIGGPSVSNFLSGDATRRTIYAHLDRQNLPGVFRTFDFPSLDATSPQRDRTTIPTQALFMMNNPFVWECTKNILKRPGIAGEKEIGTRIERLYRLLFGRPARAEEMDLAREYLGNPNEMQWARFVQALLQSNEFVFVD